MSIVFDRVKVSYGNQTIIPDFNLEIKTPGISALVGPSGCGKSTLLKTLMGLLPHQGEISSPFDAKAIGLLFQDDELLPWEDVFSNISLGLKFRKTPKKEIDQKVTEWLKRIRLSKLSDRYPGSLSGGQRKRVAIAQCLILAPQLLLLDEPFSSLDAVIRRDITDFIFGWIRENELSAILVTHDLEEAISVADQVIILNSNGTISENLNVPLPKDKPSVRKADSGYGNYVNQLWEALEKSFDFEKE